MDTSNKPYAGIGVYKDGTIDLTQTNEDTSEWVQSTVINMVSLQSLLQRHGVKVLCVDSTEPEEVRYIQEHAHKIPDIKIIYVDPEEHRPRVKTLRDWNPPAPTRITTLSCAARWLSE